MTLRVARAMLSGPLRFGDGAQLRALGFLRAVAEASDRMLACKVCKGAGINSRGYACRFCSASFAPEVAQALAVPAAAPTRKRTQPTNPPREEPTLYETSH